jgi:uncharacterized membrane protein (UPF0136 family)
MISIHPTASLQISLVFSIIGCAILAYFGYINQTDESQLFQLSLAQLSLLCLIAIDSGVKIFKTRRIIPLTIVSLRNARS